MNMVSPQQFAAISESKGVNLTKFYDEVSVIAYTAMVQELVTNVALLTDDQILDASKTIAKVSHEFADAFMRERYERTCIKATGINLKDLVKKSD